MNVLFFTLRFLWRSAFYSWHPTAKPVARDDLLEIRLTLTPNVLGKLLACKPIISGPFIGHVGAWHLEGRKLRSPLMRAHLNRLHRRYVERPDSAHKVLFRIPDEHRMAA